MYKAGIVETVGSSTLEPTEGDDGAGILWPRMKGLGISIVSHSEFEYTHELTGPSVRGDFFHLTLSTMAGIRIEVGMSPVYPPPSPA